MFLSFREFGSTSNIPSFPLAASFFKGAKASSALTLVLNFSRKSAIILPVWVVYLLLHYTSSCSSSSLLNVIVLKNEKRFIIVVSYMREVAVIIISLSQPYEWILGATVAVILTFFEKLFSKYWWFRFRALRSLCIMVLIRKITFLCNIPCW